jgi:hypothetical protein
VAGSEQDTHGNDITSRIEGVQAEAFPAAHTQFPAKVRVLCSVSILATVSAENLLALGFEAIEIDEANLKGIADPHPQRLAQNSLVPLKKNAKKALSGPFHATVIQLSPSCQVWLVYSMRRPMTLESIAAP